VSAFKALVIPESGPVFELDVPREDALDVLQGAVGGYIQALPLPAFVDPDGRATAYVHEEGKFECQPNMRATDFMVPGVGLFPGDYIAGPMVFIGFDPATGEHAELPASVAKRIRLIEREAA